MSKIIIEVYQSGLNIFDPVLFVFVCVCIEKFVFTEQVGAASVGINAIIFNQSEFVTQLQCVCIVWKGQNTIIVRTQFWFIYDFDISVSTSFQYRKISPQRWFAPICSLSTNWKV